MYKVLLGTLLLIPGAFGVYIALDSIGYFGPFAVVPGIWGAAFLWFAWKISVEKADLHGRPPRWLAWAFTLFFGLLVVAATFLALLIHEFFLALLGIVALCLWSYLSFRA